jgi:vacuolar-type H+-ATPase subunit I/STV1
MATETSGIEIKNKGLLLLGIILLVIGLAASLYEKIETGNVLGYTYSVSRGYPYQSIGVILAVAGIVFVALGFLYSSQRIPPPPPQKA